MWMSKITISLRYREWQTVKIRLVNNSSVSVLSGTRRGPWMPQSSSMSLIRLLVSAEQIHSSIFKLKQGHYWAINTNEFFEMLMMTKCNTVIVIWVTKGWEGLGLNTFTLQLRSAAAKTEAIQEPIKWDISLKKKKQQYDPFGTVCTSSTQAQFNRDLTKIKEAEINLVSQALSQRMEQRFKCIRGKKT